MGDNWTDKEAAHLLGRATFLSGKEEVTAAVKLGKDETVRRLVAGESITGKTTELLPIVSLKADGKDMSADQIGDQQTYWLYRMVNTEAPLIEKMTLFWHGHFATSYQKVKQTELMVKQNELFRKYALGSFHELVLEVGKDPAMMIWLDSNSNRKGKPNENYAREVMELFTLGIGNYTEQDIREAARAFTGWKYEKALDEVSFQPKQHDDKKKTLLGESGNFNETTVVDVLFRQEALPKYIALKLLHYFAADQPSEAWIQKVAADVKQKSTLGEVLSNLFLSDEFYQDNVRSGLIKTPIEYVAGIVKSLKLPLSKGFTQAARKMGQELYLPPDVAGWRGGASWLMSTSLLSRYQFAESVAKRVNNTLLTSADFSVGADAKPEEWVSSFGKNIGLWELGGSTAQVLSQYAGDTFVYSTQKQSGMKGLLQLLMISPEAQMK
ncbi:DUF1800 domain-containing protein [Paenibacillus thalictri]|uniref:DUF1800 domain-containing protein n=1 Tax=Paenibacillus thalictri TaxID=2527873 RepID=A0A4Q9DGV4_9BACL|nr:DUF1800 domain-containing protein [Paenibacillus thalictri]TBL70063.1 DUF1800 domain-containing protein [Paenibacillus thalictri]